MSFSARFCFVLGGAMMLASLLMLCVLLSTHFPTVRVLPAPQLEGQAIPFDPVRANFDFRRHCLQISVSIGFATGLFALAIGVTKSCRAKRQGGTA